MYKIFSNILLPKLIPYTEEIIRDVDVNATGQLLIIYSAFVKYLRKNGKTVKQ